MLYATGMWTLKGVPKKLPHFQNRNITKVTITILSFIQMVNIFMCCEILMICRFQNTPNFYHLEETQNSNGHFNIGDISV